MCTWDVLFSIMHRTQLHIEGVYFDPLLKLDMFFFLFSFSPSLALMKFGVLLERWCPAQLVLWRSDHFASSGFLFRFIWIV
mmetsp:Transcript_370/g.677  ORF Transcript_370/g.677 Transcript_370/m.677 type:complete len:81 (-) Transcript_370:139-381(-)